MMNSIVKLPVVYMDETGNKESDRFFVIGFLCVDDSEQLYRELVRVRDQIEALSRFNRLKRTRILKEEGDIEQLFNFAKSPSSFELKYKHVSNENIHLFKIFLKILIYKVNFCLDALVIDRKDPHYKHTDLKDMYKIITHMYFNYRCKAECIFVPDSFDHLWEWRSILSNVQIKAVIPGSSQALLPLQAVDILTGVIAQGLRGKEDYTNKDKVREPLLKLFTEVAKIEIKKSVTVNKPRYISIWTIDFSKTKKGAQGMDKKPNLGS